VVVGGHGLAAVELHLRPGQVLPGGPGGPAAVGGVASGAARVARRGLAPLARLAQLHRRVGAAVVTAGAQPHEEPDHHDQRRGQATDATNVTGAPHGDQDPEDSAGSAPSPDAGSAGPVSSPAAGGSAAAGSTAWSGVAAGPPEAA